MLTTAQVTTAVQVLNVGDGSASFDRYTCLSVQKIFEKCVDYDHETRKCLETKRWAVPDRQSIQRLYLNRANQGANLVFEPYFYFEQVTKWKCTKSEKVEIGDGRYERRCLRGHWETVPEPDVKWYGCGRKAAQNALRFFGIEIAQAEIAAYVRAYPMLVNNQIAVYPGHLKVGLQRLLDKFGHAKFAVELHSHMNGSDVIPYLRAGLPTVALVDNGSHWVVISGKDDGGFFVHDNWDFTRRRILDMHFNGLTALWANVDGTDYEEGTFISFKRVQ